MALGCLAPLPSLPPVAPLALQISPFGAIPKKHKPNTWCLIVDLFSPAGFSVNDAIEHDLCASYTSVDQAVTMAQFLGRGCLLANLVLKEAYRAVLVHPTIQHLLTVSWEGITYIDKSLRFGLH